MLTSEQSGEGKMINFPSKYTAEQRPILPISEVYTPRLVDFYSELGVPDQFLAMMGRYLADTKVTINNDIEESVQDVVKIRSDENDLVWKRHTQLSLKHISMLGLGIKSVIDEMDVRNLSIKSTAEVRGINQKVSSADKTSATTRTFRTIATNIAFLETTADILGNCVYMQHRFDHYIPDFNGNYYGAYDSVSREFWNSYADKADEKAHETSIAQDHRDLRSGVAMSFLKDDLLKYEVVGTMTEAQWAAQALASYYPTPRRYNSIDSPMSEEEIKLRCTGLYVRPGVLLEYAKLGD